jgi:hypothetical protein
MMSQKQAIKDANDQSPDVNSYPAKLLFSKKLARLGALASDCFADPNFDISGAEEEMRQGFTAFNAQDTLQEMLVTQILSIHQLQQTSMIAANKLENMDTKKYYINTAIKLANTFVQQANLLSKLQGKGGQRIIIERVDVHQGGQAVVGNVSGGG